MFGFDPNLLAVTFFSVVMVIIVVAIVRALAGLSNDALGYQFVLLGFGAIVSTAGMAASGTEFWPSYTPQWGLSKGVFLYSIGSLQLLLLLVAISAEKWVARSTSRILRGPIYASVSTAVGSLSLYYFVLSSVEWAGPGNHP